MAAVPATEGSAINAELVALVKKEGIVTAKLTVSKLEQGKKGDGTPAKIWNVWFAELGNHKIGVFPTLIEKQGIEVGQSEDAEIEITTNESGYLNPLLKKFGAPKGGNRGGGGKPFTPKSQAEIHGANIATLACKALELAEGSLQGADDNFKWLCKAYQNGLSHFEKPSGGGK